MSNKLYVGGIPFQSTEDELRDLFSQHGEVTSARIITDKFTGRSRGFGFVEMADDAGAAAAINALNGAEMGGRTITVSEARPMTERNEA
ncbi:MAG: RNA-binding protein [Candidatus Uhrbacteria bacterium]|nr:RNA-binding protein [Candidatus Uhrbacteria bacterium]